MTQQLIQPTTLTDQAHAVADRWTAAVTRLAELNPMIAADCLRTLEHLTGNVELYALEAVTSCNHTELTVEGTTWLS